MRDFHLPGRSPVLATNGLCATSHPLAAEAAISILRNNGNAMDAAIAGAVLLGICEPASTGIGGDCFALWCRADSHQVCALNGSGRAPAAVSAEHIRTDTITSIPLDSPHSVTIPGAIDAFCYLAETEGKLGIDKLLAPAIHYADEGVPVAPRIAFDWAQNAPILNDAARSAYLIDGDNPKTGDIFRIPAQAEVLRRIAKSGRDAFYKGEVADDMVSTLQRLGGYHTHQDFASTQCEMTRPISGTYGEFEIVEHPPNGQGLIALLMLNILKHFPIADMEPWGAERTHIEAEAAKHAYTLRDQYLADADHCRDLDRMLDPSLAAKLAGQINQKCASHFLNLQREHRHKDTVYITVVDRDRMAVSLIYSIFHGFGSGIASDKFKILLHNRGAGFSLRPQHPNELQPNKRPLHTIIPAMLRHQGRVVMPFGVMGGSYQPNGHCRLISNMVDFGLDPQSAIDAPRAFAEGDKLKLERGYSDRVKQRLIELGHDIEIPITPIGGAQAIRIHENGVLEGASDPRKDGGAIGY